MLLSLVHTTCGSPSLSSYVDFTSFSFSTLPPKSLFPAFETHPVRTLESLLYWSKRRCDINSNKFGTVIPAHVSLLEAPVLWAGGVCIFYALLKAGLGGSQASPLLSGARAGGDGDGESSDLGFSKWLESIQGKPGFSSSATDGCNISTLLFRTVNLPLCKRNCLHVDEAAERRKLVSKWLPTTKVHFEETIEYHLYPKSDTC